MTIRKYYGVSSGMPVSGARIFDKVFHKWQKYRSPTGETVN